MLIFNRSLLTVCVCIIAMINVQCQQGGSEIKTEGSTLTILVPDQDERVLGPLGANPWFLVFLGLAVDPEEIGALPGGEASSQARAGRRTKSKTPARAVKKARAKQKARVVRK